MFGDTMTHLFIHLLNVCDYLRFHGSATVGWEIDWEIDMDVADVDMASIEVVEAAGTSRLVYRLRSAAGRCR